MDFLLLSLILSPKSCGFSLKCCERVNAGCMDCFNLFSTLYWQTFQKGLEQISGELAEPTQAIRGHKGICICICICICVYICICISIFILYVFLYNCFKKFQQEARADIRRVSEAKTSNQRTKSCLHLSLYLYLYLYYAEQSHVVSIPSSPLVPVQTQVFLY